MIHKSFIWQGRLCKLEEGSLLMSAVCRYDDFDFSLTKTDANMAVAANLDGYIYEIRPMSESVLWMLAVGGEYLLIGNPANDGRIEKVAGRWEERKR